MRHDAPDHSLMIFSAEQHHRVAGLGAVEPAYAVEMLDRANPVEMLDRSDVVEMLDRSDVVEMLDRANPVEMLDRADPVEILDRADAVPMKGSDFWLVRYWVNDQLPGLQQLLE
jgi:hypothetical protein